MPRKSINGDRHVWLPHICAFKLTVTPKGKYVLDNTNDPKTFFEARDKFEIINSHLLSQC